MRKQVTLDGEDRDAPISFDCPFCGKHFDLKVEKDKVYHRPWAFHIAIDHGDFLVKHHRDDIPLWLEYWAVHDDVLGEELRRRAEADA